MNTSKLTNHVVKSAFDAWQEGNTDNFLSYFTTDALLTDDGNPRDFRTFVDHACGKEKFTSISEVSNDGREIAGDFHTESWGDFKCYFRFHVNDCGKIYQLDIGQASF